MKMTIFDERREIEQRIEAKCQRVWETFVNIAREMNVDIPSFDRGIKYSVCPYNMPEYVDNPHYNPSLPHTPENRAKDTGFQKIRIEHEMVSLHVNELEDEYEDFGCDSYHLMIPKDAFFEVGDIQLKTFVRGHLQKEADRKERNYRSNYLNVFDFDFEKVQRIIDVCKNIENPSNLDYQYKVEILKKIGIMEDGD